MQSPPSAPSSNPNKQQAQESILEVIAHPRGAARDEEVIEWIKASIRISGFLAVGLLVFSVLMYALYDTIDEASLVVLVVLMAFVLAIFLSLVGKERQPQWVIAAFRRRPWLQYMLPLGVLSILTIVVILNASEGAITSTFIIIGVCVVLGVIGLVINHRCKRASTGVEVPPSSTK
jgi:uncharacterized membrane protein